MTRFEGLGGLLDRATAITVKVATSPKQFEGLTISKAIYGSNWDRDVLLVANSNGAISLVVP